MEKELKRLRKGQLQDKLRNISLDTTGFKSDLITRLISHTFESKEPGNADVSLNDKNQCPDAQFKDKSNKSSTTQPKKSSGLEGFVKQTAERKTSVDEEVDSNQKTGSDKNLHYQTESEINHPDAELSNDSNDNILNKTIILVTQALIDTTGIVWKMRDLDSKNTTLDLQTNRT